MLKKNSAKLKNLYITMHIQITLKTHLLTLKKSFRETDLTFQKFVSCYRVNF